MVVVTYFISKKGMLVKDDTNDDYTLSNEMTKQLVEGSIRTVEKNYKTKVYTKNCTSSHGAI